MKRSADEVRIFNIKRQTNEHYQRFADLFEVQEFYSAYEYLGYVYRAIGTMEADQQQYYIFLINKHNPAAQIVEKISHDYSLEYQRALRLAQAASDLCSEEILLVLTLRDTLSSVYTVLFKVFHIALKSLNELDQTILVQLGHRKLSGVSGRLYHKIRMHES